MMKRKLPIIALLLTLISCMWAQHPILRNFSIKDYRGGTQNWKIEKTSGNVIFVANNMGLMKYDSRQWSSFPLPNYTNVRSILYDSLRHCVWAGGTNEFGYFKHDVHKRVVYHSVSDLLPIDRRKFGEIWNIMKKGNDLIFQSKDRLFFLHTDNNAINIVKTPLHISCSVIIGGKLLVAGDNGVYIVEGAKCSPLPGVEMVKDKNILAILPYLEKYLIFCTEENGLFLYDGQCVRPFLSELTPFLSENMLYCASIHKDMLAIGTVRKGLLLRNLKTGKTLYANTETGLADNTVLSVCFDELDNIWLGLDKGVAYVMQSFPVNCILGKNSQIGTGYATAIFGGRLYMGTNQGLFSVPFPLVRNVTPTVPNSVNGIKGQIWGLFEINGTLLCGSNSGAFLVKDNTATKIQGPDGTWCFTRLKVHPEYVLGCDYNGLFLLRSSDMRYEGRVEGFNESSGAVFEDSDGSIWMSHWRKGVYRLTLSADCRKVVKSVRFGKGNGLLLDNDNILCRVNGEIRVSCVDGIYKYNRKTGKLGHDMNLTELFNTYGEPLRLMETPSHDIWAYKPGYLAIARPDAKRHYSVDSLTYKTLLNDLQMGLGHVGFIPAKDQTIFNTLDGFVIADNKTRNKILPTRLYIEEIRSISSGDSLLYACSTDSVDMVYTVSHDNNSLRIRFVMPEYVNSDEIEYSCMLKGYDDGWSQWQTGNTKDYTKLPKGKYTFFVRARNKNTGFEDEYSVVISVEPAFYETWWAYCIYIIGIVIILYLIVNIARQRQARKIRLVEIQKEKELKQQQAEHDLERQRLRNEQLEVELKHRQSELGDSTMNLMRKNDMLQSLDQQLSELSESVRREDVKAKITQKIRDIRHDVQNNINDDDGWEKFEENFNLVYDNYMKKLIECFPDLKKNDRKLCAYLRMGLSSKEIASLLNTSVRSIETARYRLRKKLELEQGSNLTDFLQSLGK